MLRRVLRELVDRALVGPRPAPVRPAPPSGARWTEAAAPAAPEPEPDLEVELPVPGSLLLDIREPGELAGGIARGALCIPMDMVPHQLDHLPRDRAITVYCAAGARSWGVAHWLREQGFGGAVSLAGGIGAVGATERPPGAPGRTLDLPAGWVEGVWQPAPRGEVILQDGAVLRCRVRDAQGFWVERRVAVADPAGRGDPGRGSASFRGGTPDEGGNEVTPGSCRAG